MNRTEIGSRLSLPGLCGYKRVGDAGLEINTDTERHEYTALVQLPGYKATRARGTFHPDKQPHFDVVFQSATEREEVLLALDAILSQNK